jgi:hypothetical protein
MSPHASRDSSPAPCVSAAWTPCDAPGPPAPRGREFAAYGIAGGLVPPLGPLGPLLGAAPRAVGAAGVPLNPGFHR